MRFLRSVPLSIALLGVLPAGADALSITLSSGPSGEVLYRSSVTSSASFDLDGCKPGDKGFPRWLYKLPGMSIWAPTYGTSAGGTLTDKPQTTILGTTSYYAYVTCSPASNDGHALTAQSEVRSYTVVNQLTSPPGVGGGGGGGGGISKPPPDACAKRNGWLYGPKGRAYAAGLAQAARDMAGDGHDLADDLDIISVTAKLVARAQLDDNAKRVFDALVEPIQKSLREEYELTRRESQYANGANKAFENYRAELRKAAELRRQASDPKLTRKARIRKNRSDVVRARNKIRQLEEAAAQATARASRFNEAWRVLQHGKLGIAQKLANVRRLTGVRLTKLAAPLNRFADTGFGKFLGGVLGKLNLAQDVATVYEYYWLTISWLANQWAKPPAGCGELWLPYVPRSTEPFSAWDAYFPPSKDPIARGSATSYRRGLPPALGSVGARRLVGAVRARRIDRAARQVTAGVAALRALAPEAARGRRTSLTRTARRNVAAILRGAALQLSHMRTLTSELSLPTVRVTAEALAAFRPGMAAARARLRYWQAAPSLFPATAGTPPPVGSVLDYDAALRGERVAAAIARLRASRL